MTDAKKHKPEDTPDNYLENLDAMLNVAESLIEKKESSKANDEDIMEQLIMENVFDVADEEIAKQSEEETDNKPESTKNDMDTLNENKNITEKKTDSSDNMDITAQENYQPEIPAMLLPKSESAKNDVQQSNLDHDRHSGLDKPTGNLTFQNKIDDITAVIAEEKCEQHSSFLASDLDISSDSGISAADINTPEPDSNDVLFSEQSNTADLIAELSIKISQLAVDNNALKQQISNLTSSSTNKTEVENKLGALQEEQQRLKGRIVNQKKPPQSLTYAALALAGISMVVVSGIGVVGYKAKSDVTELSQSITTLEKETNFLVSNSSKINIEKLNTDIKLLIKTDGDLNAQLDEVNNMLKISSLKPVVTDLVEHNNQVQQVVSELIRKIAQLEKQNIYTSSLIARAPAANASKSNKPAKIATIAKDKSWVVNLVSFKQEWYAKNKAAEFEKKGITADILPIDIKGESWYRLRVKGFESRYDAAAYAVKIKKSLNLSSVWVASL